MPSQFEVCYSFFKRCVTSVASDQESSECGSARRRGVGLVAFGRLSLLMTICLCDS